MATLKKLGRLFTIKTRTEAWLVIYAIAVGAVERGHHYLQMYPGFAGWLLAVACTGVVFVAGGKLLDSVRPEKPSLAGALVPAQTRKLPISRSRPTMRRVRSGAVSRPWPGTGSPPTRSPFAHPEA
jgi:hypothetical protein